MEMVFLIGRLIFGGYFLLNGINHLLKLNMLKNYASSKGVPLPEISVIISGIFIIMGGLGIIFGFFVNLAVLLIAIFLLLTAFFVHSYWKLDLPEEKTAQELHFFKNLALLGADLMIVMIPSPWPFSIYGI